MPGREEAVLAPRHLHHARGAPLTRRLQPESVRLPRQERGHARSPDPWQSGQVGRKPSRSAFRRPFPLHGAQRGEATGPDAESDTTPLESDDHAADALTPPTGTESDRTSETAQTEGTYEHPPTKR